jgi:hypothetical protein
VYLAAIIARCTLYLRHLYMDEQQVTIDAVQEKARQLFPEIAGAFALHVATGILAAQLQESGIEVTWPNAQQDFTAFPG